MPIPAPEEFWSLVAASRLVPSAALTELRREYESAPPPPAAGDDPTTSIAKWLVKRAAVSRWQARRLLGGDRGPFFVGAYRLMDRLEADGPGRLYRARHDPSGRPVCLMMLDRQICQRPDSWDGIVRRVAVSREATDPVLSRTGELEQDPRTGNRFLLCEDVEGSALADELSRLGPLEPAAACRVMLDLTRGVAELHRRGTVHGGISLDAIRLAPPAAAGVDAIGVPGGRTVRLLQSPLAGDPHAAPAAIGDATERIARLGRRASFVPPELVPAGGVADPRSDIYSLGCVFHALLTGVAPCWKGDAQRTLSQASTSGPEALGPPRVPVEIATLVAYMVARDPAGRYQNAAEAADAIATCLGLPPVSPALPPQQPPIDPPAAAAVTADVAPPFLDVKSAKASVAVDQRKAARRRRLVATAAGGGILAAALTGVLLVVLTRGGSTDKAAPPAGPDRTASKAAAKSSSTLAAEKPRESPEANVEPAAESTEPTANAGPRHTLVDSPDLPWASPTAGGSPTLDYMPPGAQLVLLARPADLLASDEGDLFVRALGPRVEAGIDMLATLCGTGLDGVEEVLGGWQAVAEAGAEQGDVVGGWVVRLVDPTELAADRKARTKAWGETKEKKVGGETIHVGKTLSFWFPSAEEGRVLAIAPEPLLRQMAEATEAAGAEADSGDRLPAGLSPDMESLVGMLDRTRHVTLLGSPHYLLHDGRPVLAGALARLVDPIHGFFGDDVKAAAVSLHFGDDFYLELDAVPSRDEPAKSLARRLATGVDTWGDSAEDAVASASLHEYGRKLVMRLPTMIRTLAANARFGAEGRAAVLNAYLPRHAAHNLVLATELALEQPAGRAAGAAAAMPAAQPAAAGALARLQQKMSLAFAKDTLEKSVQMIADEIGVPIEILGSDLQLEGITKNQSFGLEERDKTADAILRSILAKSDPAGRLVYVVRKQGGEETLAVTTRAAVAKRGDTLPPGFDARAAGKPADAQPADAQKDTKKKGRTDKEGTPEQ